MSFKILVFDKATAIDRLAKQFDQEHFRPDSPFLAEFASQFDAWWKDSVNHGGLPIEGYCYGTEISPDFIRQQLSVAASTGATAGLIERKGARLASAREIPPALGMKDGQVIGISVPPLPLPLPAPVPGQVWHVQGPRGPFRAGCSWRAGIPGWSPPDSRWLARNGGKGNGFAAYA